MTYKITEQYVLDNCLHNDESVIRDVFFPQFKDELETETAPTSIGYQSPVYVRKPMTFDEWKVARYKELRAVSYASIVEQLEMQVDGTWLSHIEEVKAKYPKGAECHL